MFEPLAHSPILVCCLLLAADPKSAPVRYEANLDAMGGVFSLTLYGADKYKLEAAANSAFDEIRRLDGLLSNYKPTSEWSEVNRRAGQAPVRISQELFDLLASCVEYSRQSEGGFDITVGPLMKIWGFYKKEGRMPHRSEIRGALANLGWQNIELDAKARTVRFKVPGLELDPGGIGKGYAADRVAAILRDAGIQSAFLSASTSTLYAIGTPPGEKGWHVRIDHPKDRKRMVAELWLKDESMSTSGNYEKFFEVGGRRYSHIMDPRSGYPSEGMISVSVVAPRAIDSEAWTKPVYVNGRAWMEQAQRRQGALRAFRVFTCEDTGGPEPRCGWLPASTPAAGKVRIP